MDDRNFAFKHFAFHRALIHPCGSSGTSHPSYFKIINSKGHNTTSTCFSYLMEGYLKPNSSCCLCYSICSMSHDPGYIFHICCLWRMPHATRYISVSCFDIGMLIFLLPEFDLGLCLAGLRTILYYHHMTPSLSVKYLCLPLHLPRQALVQLHFLCLCFAFYSWCCYMDFL